MRERLVVLYSGRVQGVGFRWTTANAVRDLPVTGYVRNLPDGRVRLVLEGDAGDVHDAAGRVRSALARYIDGEESETLPYAGEFADFEVRR